MTTLPASSHIGFAHLQVSDLARAVAFYRDLVGFREVSRSGPTVTLSATGTPPAHLILTGHPGARPKPPRTTGLYHVAIRLPDRPALARLLKRLSEQKWPLQGAADHGVSLALYLTDPDGNGLELYTDRPRDQWRYDSGKIAMVTDPLDVPDLLAQAHDTPWDGIDPGADIGHMHLQVSDLTRAEAFYVDLLGLDVMQRSYPGALFVAAGGYHHHLGLNTWAGQGAPPPPPDAVGLAAFSLALPDEDAYSAVVERLRGANLPVEPHHGGVLVRDSDQNGVVLTVTEI